MGAKLFYIIYVVSHSFLKKRKFFHFLFFASFLFLPGCYIDYDFHSSPLNVECTDLQDNVEEALSTTSLAVGELPCPNWWEFFNDEQLNRLISAGLACNPDIKIASALLRLAAEEALHARSTLYPHCNFDANVFRQKISDGVAIPSQKTLFTEAGLDFVGYWDLDVWNKKRSLYYADLDLVLAAQADRKAAVLLLSSAITQVYFDMQGNLARLEIAKERLIARKSLYQLNAERFRKGINSEIAAAQTDLEARLIENQIQWLEGEIEVSMHALAALVGNTIDCCSTEGDVKVAPSASFDSPVPLPCALPLELIARRPEITAQKWRIESFCYQIKSAQAAFYPNINLLGYIGFRGMKMAKILQMPNLELLGEGALDLPIFNAGELQSNLGIAREKYEVAVEEYNQMILTAIEQVCDSLTLLITADERIKTVKKAVHDADLLYRLNQLRFVKGIDPYLNVLESLENLYLQRDLEAIIQVLRLKAAASLIQSIGGCYHE